MKMARTRSSSLPAPPAFSMTSTGPRRPRKSWTLPAQETHSPEHWPPLSPAVVPGKMHCVTQSLPAQKRAAGLAHKAGSSENVDRQKFEYEQKGIFMSTNSGRFVWYEY